MDRKFLIPTLLNTTITNITLLYQTAFIIRFITHTNFMLFKQALTKVLPCNICLFSLILASFLLSYRLGLVSLERKDGSRQHHLSLSQVTLSTVFHLTLYYK